MFLTVHAAAGVAIGTFVPNVPLAFGLGLLSHFLLDRVPHYDPPMAPGTAKDGVLRHPVFRRFMAIAAVDLALAAMLTTVLAKSLPHIAWINLAAGAFGGVLPDLLFGLYRLTNNRWLAIYNRWHEANHVNPEKFPMPFVMGITTQLVTLVICLGLIFR